MHLPQPSRVHEPVLVEAAANMQARKQARKKARKHASKHASKKASKKTCNKARRAGLLAWEREKANQGVKEAKRKQRRSKDEPRAPPSQP